MRIGGGNEGACPGQNHNSDQQDEQSRRHPAAVPRAGPLPLANEEARHIRCNQAGDQQPVFSSAFLVCCAEGLGAALGLASISGGRRGARRAGREIRLKSVFLARIIGARNVDKEGVPRNSASAVGLGAESEFFPALERVEQVGFVAAGVPGSQGNGASDHNVYDVAGAYEAPRSLFRSHVVGAAQRRGVGICVVRPEFVSEVDPNQGNTSAIFRRQANRLRKQEQRHEGKAGISHLGWTRFCRSDPGQGKS